MFIIIGMKKLNTYIAKQIIVGYLLVSFSLMSIIWLSQSLRFVDLLTNKGLSLGIFIEMTSLLMPRIYTILSPISLFAAVLFVYNRMLSDRELIVMKAAGINPWNNAKPALIVGMLLCVFNFYVLNIVIPDAEDKFNDLQWQVKNDVSHLMLRDGEFTTLQPNLTVFISTHEKDGSIRGILINDERNPKTKSTVSAEMGRIVYGDKGPRIILINGTRQEINPASNQFSSISFSRYSVDFGLKNNKAKQKEAGVREKSLSELLFAADDPTLTPKEVNRHIVEGNKRFITPLLNILFAVLGCTGLLVGNFNRRGQIKIVSLSVASMIIIQALDLAFTNLAAKHLYLLPLVYLNLLLPFGVCIFLLRFYSPALWHKKIAAFFSGENHA